MARSFSSASILSTNNYTTGLGMSFAVWLNTTSGSGTRCIWRNDGGNTNNPNNTDVGAYLTTASNTFNCLNSNGVPQASTFNLTTGTWAHIGWAIAGGGTLTHYGNGIAAGTFNDAALVSFASTIKIGNDGFGQPITGNMTDFALWTVALTAGEFAALANGARPSKIRPASLGLWYSIDGLTSPEPDLSGLANNGILTNTALVGGPPINMLTPRWPRFLTPAAAASTVQRRTLDNLGTRVGSRQMRAA